MPLTSPDRQEIHQGSLQELILKVRQFNPDVDGDLIEKAYTFSAKLHKGQKRSSGEPYFFHPLEVAKILAELQLDTASIVTGLLHDTVEDTVATLEEIEKEFGSEIAALVDGVTKISQITFQTSEEKQAENFRKMILAMAKDLRVILVKLADRTHNMRTLEYLAKEKQVLIAQETLDIYGPIANRLGLSQLKRELEDLALRFTKPEIYYRLVTEVAKKYKEREKYIEDVRLMIQQTLKDHGYSNGSVTGRPKHFYSIHKKMERNQLNYDQIFDVTGFRIIVDSVEQCYGALGMIHAMWTPVPGRFKDYIAIPKANFYQSLHTTVVGPAGERIEIQIRTEQMHQTAERGIAAHWAYKEGNVDPKEREKFSWLNRLVEWNQDLKDPNEFLETVKLDLFAEDVYVFTPKGKVMEFPSGATPIDFAYSIHTDVGHHCIGAKINGRIVPLKHKLKSGDTVEILTSPNQRPNKDWLKIVRTSRAKNKIRQFIKAAEFERSFQLGRMILERELKAQDVKVKNFPKESDFEPITKQFGYKSTDDLLSAIGYGKVSISKIIQKLVQKETTEEKKVEKKPIERIYEEAARKSKTRQTVKVKGIEDLLVRFARCCNPVPGDSVIGFITRGRGISVHSRKCPKVFDSDPHRLIDIEWDLSQKTERRVKVRVVCEDRPGLLADMSRVIRDQNANISNAQIGTTKDKKAVCVFSVTIRDLSHLKKIISSLEAISGVISVGRVQKGP
ncbi:MAG: bifunctional (p)ppGpp synthetase/guanosine-3',5'-bis(diphosphate) 3'-pyrophosphohydrolase [Deltaproteobacteria bacterium]|nr:bifunctional (p)ppGpp synthetase/guanosine-3',5'-bis(diphosphate) 3'-pyrophosphohydrolase [Deltaproteobacteria bacterium]